MANFIIIVLQSALPCILLSLGIFLTYRILDFADLTAEGSFLLGSAMTIVMIHDGLNPFLATFLGFLIGVACGVVTACLNRFLKIPKLLSGIITLTASGSLALVVMGVDQTASSLSGTLIFNSKIQLKDGQNSIYSLFFGGAIPNDWVTIIVMAIFVLVIVVAMYYFFGTEYGMAIRSTGINEKMAKAQGINTTLATIVCIALSNGLIALAGSLAAQRLRSITPNDATGYLVVGLAAILIGEAVFGKRTFKNRLISICLGTVVYFIIVQLAYKIGFPTALNKLLYAILITLALCLPMIKTGIKKIAIWLFHHFSFKNFKKGVK